MFLYKSHFVRQSQMRAETQVFSLDFKPIFWSSLDVQNQKQILPSFRHF